MYSFMIRQVTLRLVFAEELESDYATTLYPHLVL